MLPHVDIGILALAGILLFVSWIDNPQQDPKTPMLTSQLPTLAPTATPWMLPVPYTRRYTLDSLTNATLDWCHLTVTRRDLDVISSSIDSYVFETSTGKVFPAVVEEMVGHQGRRVAVLAEFGGNITSYIGRFRKGEHPLRTFALSPTVERIQDPEVIFGDQVMDEAESSTPLQTPATRIDRLAFTAPTLDRLQPVAVIFRTRKSMHPVVDYHVRCSVKLPSDESFLVRFPGAVKISAIDGSDQMDEVVISGDTVSLERSDQASAPTLRFRVTYAEAVGDQSLHDMLLWSASSDSPCGYPTDIDEHRFLTLGLVPQGSIAWSERMLDGFSSVSSLWAARTGAQARSANQSGTQRFGAAFGSVIRHLDPCQARAALRFVATDEELRPVHWFTRDGSPIGPGTNPKLRTHNRRIDWRNTKDKLGLTVEPPKVGAVSKRTTDDEQHADDLAIAAYLALWRDPALQETMHHMVHLDVCDTQLLHLQTNSAARGVGRPMLSTANAAWLLNGSVPGGVAQQTVVAQINAVLAVWEGKSVMAVDYTRPVKPVATLTGNDSWALVDPRTGADCRVAAPYEHAATVTGLLAAAQVVPTMEMSRTALGLAYNLVRSVISWTTVNVDGERVVPFIISVLDVPGGPEDGNALPIEWRTEGSAEFLQICKPGGSWTAWSVGAMIALSYLESLGFVFSREEKRIASEIVVRILGLDPRDATYLVADRMAAVPESVRQAQPVAFPAHLA